MFKNFVLPLTVAVLLVGGIAIYNNAHVALTFGGSADDPQWSTPVQAGDVTGSSSEGQTAEFSDACLVWPNRTVPACFPDNIPVFPKLEVSASEGDPFDGEYLLQGVTGSGIDTVYRYYVRRADALGWKPSGYEKQAANSTVHLAFSRYRADNNPQQFQVSLSPIRWGTRVTLQTRGAGTGQ